MTDTLGLRKAPSRLEADWAKADYSRDGLARACESLRRLIRSVSMTC